MINHLFDIQKKVRIHPVRIPNKNVKDLYFDVARFDELHPVVSGNKFFKLKYNIESAIHHNKVGIITMGGAFSNHLVATAFASNLFGLSSIGIVRGEIPQQLNQTLTSCIAHNMQLISVQRNEFSLSSNIIKKIIDDYPDFHFIPMGGDNDAGIRGAAEMTEMIPEFHFYDVILCSVGSGTMLKGLSRKISEQQELIGITAMKIKSEDKINFSNTLGRQKNIQIFTEYAGKGYGKADDELIFFMNQMFQLNQLPLDFVYTAKLMNAIPDLLKRGIINQNKNLLVIHSGGLQGNHALSSSTLQF